MRKTTLFLLSIIFLAGCSSLTLKKSSYVANPSGPSFNPGNIRRVAIFPFADYSYQQSFVEPLRWGLNTEVIEDLTDEFIKKGIMVVAQEDVNGLLISEDIMKPVETEEVASALERIQDNLQNELSAISPEYELKRKGHSEEMYAEIKGMTNDKNKEAVLNRVLENLSLKEPVLQGATVSLSGNKIKELGAGLGADVIVRGRIIEAGNLKKTANPAFSNQGVVSSILNPLKIFFFGQGDAYASLGYAQQEKYEDGILDAYSFKASPTGTNVALVEIRIYLQDVKTGEIIWSGRAESTYNPNIFKKYPKDMFDKVVRKTTVSLARDLFKKRKK
jgi:hypothetical protein